MSNQPVVQGVSKAADPDSLGDKHDALPMTPKWFLRYALLPLLLVFNLPGFTVMVSAMGIRKTGSGRIPRFNVLVLSYPVIPVFFVFWALATWSSVDPNYLGIIYALLVFFTICVIGAEVNFVLAALFTVILTAAAACLGVVQGTGAYDVLSTAREFVADYGPGFPVRFLAWLVAPLAILNAFVLIGGYVSSMAVTPDNFRPGSIQSASEIDRARHSFHTWTEWDNKLWMLAVSLYLLPDDSGARLESRDQLRGKAILEFPVVPCGKAMDEALKESRDRETRRRNRAT